VSFVFLPPVLAASLVFSPTVSAASLVFLPAVSSPFLTVSPAFFASCLTSSVVPSCASAASAAVATDVILRLVFFITASFPFDFLYKQNGRRELTGRIASRRLENIISPSLAPVLCSTRAYTARRVSKAGHRRCKALLSIHKLESAVRVQRFHSDADSPE